jgi:hypothetical protein
MRGRSPDCVLAGSTLPLPSLTLAPLFAVALCACEVAIELATAWPPSASVTVANRVTSAPPTSARGGALDFGVAA